jgi:hypothetical protein
MTPGSAILLGKWRINEYEFEVWQRKNPRTLEPFATGLFVRRGTNRWEVFCLDVQDTYHPRIELRLNATKVDVLKKGKNIGSFDLGRETFQRTTCLPFVPGGIGTAASPPGQWWL